MSGLAIDFGQVGSLPIERSLWWRIYASAYAPDQFNASAKGDARFSPIEAAGAGGGNASVIPTMYCGSTPAVALMETVLHDMPHPSAGFILTLPPEAQEVRRGACLVVNKPLLLADFTAIGLRRVGLRRGDVIDTDKPSYPVTRDLAERLHAARPDLQGICWTSRQDDRGLAMVLFGDRIAPGALVAWHHDVSIRAGLLYEELLDLLDGLGAGLVLG